ncbi:MAG: ATPase AAA [Candidatus Hydrogenedentota bacterium]
MHVPVSPEINRLLDDAAEASVRRGRFYVGVEFVYESLLANADALPKPFRSQYESTLKAALPEMGREAWRGSMPTANPEVFYTPRCAALTSQAARLAARLGNEQPSAGHLLLAILADAQAAPSRAIDRLGKNRGEMIQALRNELLKKSGGTIVEQENRTSATRSDSASQAAGPEEAEPAAPKQGVLEKLTRDLTKMAVNGKLEPAIGRDQDIMTMVEILARKTKNNVMLVGEAGVGKTRVVEGLAASIVTGGMGGILPNYRILELSLAALTAGTQYRGQFEEKLLKLLEKLKSDDKTVLFIDEAHLIMGSGSVEGGTMDLANMLKPALARGEIRCIGATTMAEYRKFIEKDPAMERRFQLVRIEPLSTAATYDVLKKMRPSLEKHHQCKISKTALKAAIELTERYMPNRQLPDKAIDVLDQACSRYRLKQVAAKSNPKLFESSQSGDDEDKVRPHDVRKVVSRATGIPIEDITAEERVRLSDLERKLNRRIIGQEEAVAKVVAAVKKSRAGLGARNRPESVMMFLGPTGVGKTQLAKELSKFLFGSTNHLITFDMSEYLEEHSVSRLLGAPPGYVGSDEEGRLTAAVRNAPFSVLLFDEVEKAHRRIFDIFLPILDEGRLKDSRGRMVDFRHCIILFTSNIGAEFAKRGGDTEDRHVLLDALHKHFRPEFINRIDEIVPFYPLVFEDIRKVLQVSLRDAQKRLMDKGMKLRVYQRAYEFLAEQGYDAKFGARELNRTVERLVVQPVSEAIIDGRFANGDVIEVLMENGHLAFQKGEHRAEAEAVR